MDKPILIPNPALSSDEAFDAGMSLLEQASALLSVHDVGSANYVNLLEQPPATAAAYVEAVKTLVEAGADAIQASTFLKKSRKH